MLLVGMIGLAAGHSVALYYVKSRATLSAAVVSGVIVLVVTKHLGLLGPLYALVRRRSRQARSGASVARGPTPGHPSGEVEGSRGGK
jgi:hypothetical protein